MGLKENWSSLGLVVDDITRHRIRWCSPRNSDIDMSNIGHCNHRSEVSRFPCNLKNDLVIVDVANTLSLVSHL